MFLIAFWPLLGLLEAMSMDRWADRVGVRGGGQDHDMVAGG